MLINSEEMGKSPSSGHPIINKNIPSIVGGVLLGLGCLISLISAFRIDVKWDDLFLTGPVGGFINCWDQVAHLFGKEHYILLNVYEGGDGNGLFLILLFMLLACVGYLTLSISPWLSAAMYILPLIIVSVMFGFHPAFYGIILMALGIMVVLVSGDTFDVQNAGEVLPIIRRIGVMAVVAGIATAVFLIPAVHKNLTGIPIIETGRSIRAEKWEEMRYTDEPDLTVTMDRPESVYLRGFVGEDYGSDGWKSLPTSKIYENIDREYWLAQEGFNAMSQLAQVDKLIEGGSGTSRKVDIEVGGKKSRYAYVPYELASEYVDGTKNWGNSFLTFDSRKACRSYNYTMVDNKTGSWTDEVGKLFTARLSDEIDEYRRLESYYNVDMYSRYTYLDDSIIDILNENVGSRGNQEKGHVDYKTAITKVKKYMDDNIVYSETATVKKGDNAVKTFFGRHSGTDEDYATVATLMFRYYGIPSRYVKGALVTLEDEKAMKPGRPYKLDGDKNHHAWTEIYVDSLGWIPIEACSGFYGIMEEADLNKGLENESSAAPFDKAENNLMQNPQGNNEREGGRKIPWKLILKIIAASIAFILLIYLAIRLIRRIIRGRKIKKAFHQTDVRKAICAVYGYMQRNEIPCEAEAEAIAMRGAYSFHPMTESDRGHMLRALKRGKESLKDKRRRTK